MKATIVVVAIAVIMFLVGCVDQPASPELHSDELVDLSRMDAALSKRVVENFIAPLSGDQEVPPVDTRARGNSIFQLSKDGSELSYKLIVANIENVTQAHIHCGAEGVNGPVVLWLYPEGPPAVLIPGRFNGVLAEGTRTAGDVVERPASDACPGGVANFDDLLTKMRNGEAYVNVHTSQFPPGEIRGQINRGNAVRP